MCQFLRKEKRHAMPQSVQRLPPGQSFQRQPTPLPQLSLLPIVFPGDPSFHPSVNASEPCRHRNPAPVLLETHRPRNRALSLVGGWTLTEGEYTQEVDHLYQLHNITPCLCGMEPAWLCLQCDKSDDA